jgi:hypothetical protein
VEEGRLRWVDRYDRAIVPTVLGTGARPVGEQQLVMVGGEQQVAAGVEVIAVQPICRAWPGRELHLAAAGVEVVA